MISFISSVLGFFFPTKDSTQDENEQDDFLAEQLLDLELKSKEEEDYSELIPTATIPNNKECFQKTGVITYKNDTNVLIDGMLYFDSSNCNIGLNVNDVVAYLGYKDENESITVVRILENHGTFWGEEDLSEENKFKVIEHTVVGEVDKRADRWVFMKNNDLKFSLDDVEASFIPIKGDWIELTCTVQWDENKPSDISAAQVLKVISFQPLRSKVSSATVTNWSGETGICDKSIFFNKQSYRAGVEPTIGSKVMVEAIESSQGTCTWRAIKIILLESKSPENETNETPTAKEEGITLDIEESKNITVTYPTKFVNVDFHQTGRLNIEVTNNSNQIYTINKWIMLSKKRDSQIDVKPFISQPKKLFPGETFTLAVTCYPKFLGSTKECFIILFRGFQVKRFIEINVTDQKTQFNGVDSKVCLRMSETDKIKTMKQIRKRSENIFVPGVRPVKPPAFVPVKLGAFPIPNRVWAAVLGDSEQTVYCTDFKKIIDRLETNLPCLSQDLNIGNYIDKWHTLLYIEEVQANISMRSYDTPKTFLIRCQEYLGIEIIGLSEKRPSLIKGDRVVVKDIWDTLCPQYEGFIHDIKGNLVLMKFNHRFHESYSGSDVSIEYHFSRSTYRRAHQAINLALSNLGPEILFPTKVLKRTPQINPDKLNDITWFNNKLNFEQKEAVKNILLGECRPMPYCIYGPPGTGKTVTVIETILQILTNIPHSRILVATPSNSASNLITERLVESKKACAFSIVRIIANYLVDSENLPDVIKPFCATLDIAREETNKPKQEVRNGVNVHCQSSYIGRHRVTIGTCYCIGALAQMGLPRGHFTHIIIDEAGQATEPEIMIPMTFTDKENAQIILAGDPMQLGPVILSRYCQEFDMDESFLSRILETFPYQRDFDAFSNGFNNKLVTRLNENYRSLSEVLTLPSQMFYDGSLIEKIDRNQQWIGNIVNIMSDIFGKEDKQGGIFVYGIRGQNARAEDSPSWYNPQEASMVALTTCKLFKKNINADDIGIITPYIAQIKYLRLLFDAMGLPQPKIGTVEEFQGQERPIILISTVRSTESMLPEDQKHTLGFVKNPKRLNVALTRAQVAVILFCNPHLLCRDDRWKKVITNSVQEDKYTGCDLHLSLNNI